MISQPVLVAFVGVEGYGVWASTIAIASLFSLGGDLGVASALPKLIAERRGRRQDEGTLASSSLLFALFTGSVAAGALALCAPLLGGFVNFPNLTLLLRIQSLQMPFNFALGSLLARLQGARNFRAYSLAATTLAVANVILMAAFLVLGTGLPGVITASLLATVGVFCLMMVVYRKSVPFRGISAFKRDISVLVPFGVQLTLSIILSQIMYQIDVVLLSLWLRNAQVIGMYALGRECGARGLRHETFVDPARRDQPHDLSSSLAVLGKARRSTTVCLHSHGASWLHCNYGSPRCWDYSPWKTRAEDRFRG